MRAEEWRDVPSYEGLYQISNHGRIRSLPRPNRKSTLELVPKDWFKTGAGYDQHYKRVPLYKGGKRKWFYVHRLVLFAFVGPPPSKRDHGCHADANGANNHVDNLRWDSPEENWLERGDLARDPETGQFFPRSLWEKEDLLNADEIEREERAAMRAYYAGELPAYTGPTDPEVPF